MEPGLTASMRRTDVVPGAPRIAYDIAGSGELVVFLHGIGGNRSNWTAQIERLADEFQAVAWDARGYGASDDYEGPLDFRDFSRDLLRLLDHLGAARAHIVGLSMGGQIALDFYDLYPRRVASLVLCDTFPGFDTSFTPAQRDEFIRSRTEPLLRGMEPRDIALSIAATLVSPTTAPERVAELAETSMGRLRKGSYIKTVTAMTQYPPFAALARIDVPTLVLVGEHDQLTPPAISQGMAAAIPGAQLCVLAEAGHVPNFERPEAFNDALLAFLRSRAR